MRCFKQFNYILNKVDLYIKYKIEYFIHMYPNKASNIVNFFFYIIMCFILFGFFFSIVPQDIKNFWNPNTTLDNARDFWLKWVLYKQSKLELLEKSFTKSYIIFSLLKYVLYTFYFLCVRAFVGLIYKNVIHFFIFISIPEKDINHYGYCLHFVGFINTITQLLSLWILLSFLCYALFYLIVIFI